VEWGEVLELQGLTRRYGDLVALDGLSFTVGEGQLFGFVGSNGAGKTTAMRIILGCWRPTPARSAGAENASSATSASRSSTAAEQKPIHLSPR
jgi:ABC-type multidrug transport system ATPase subunit